MDLISEMGAGEAQMALEQYIVRIESVNLAEKFQVVNLSPWAISLGICVSLPEVEYPLVA